jgi:small subunit ribosomal protein S6
MVRYEALILTIPEITQDEIKALESHVNSVASKTNGTVVSFERWGKYKLSYPIKKNDYGIYFLTRFESTQACPALLKDMQTLFAVKLNDTVMRSMISNLDPKASLAYQRPQSLEEAPAKEVGGFMREGRGDYEGRGEGRGRDFRRSYNNPEQEADDMENEEN